MTTGGAELGRGPAVVSGADPHLMVAIERALAGAGLEAVGLDADAPDAGAIVAQAVVLVFVAGDAAGARAAELETLCAQAPGVPAVVVSSATAPGTLRELLRAGARAVVEAHAVARALPSAVAAVAAGYALLPASAVEALWIPPLSNREKQVLAMLILGLSYKDIAARLFVAESTVKTHVIRSFRKLGVSSRREAVALILDPEQGLGTGILAISSH